jgi:hypothetical protein
MQPVNILQRNWLYSYLPPGRLSTQSAEGDYRGTLHYLVAAPGISQRGFLPFSAAVRILSASPLIMYTGMSSFSCSSIGECPPPKVFCCYSWVALTQCGILTSTHFLPFHHCTRNSCDLSVSQLKPPYTRVSTSSPLDLLGRRL